MLVNKGVGGSFKLVLVNWGVSASFKLVLVNQGIGVSFGLVPINIVNRLVSIRNILSYGFIKLSFHIKIKCTIF